MISLNLPTSDFDTTVDKVDAWWDPSLRLWVCQWLNAAGDQLGAAQYANRKSEKNALVARMEKTEPTDYQI